MKNYKKYMNSLRELKSPLTIIWFDHRKGIGEARLCGALVVFINTRIIKMSKPSPKQNDVIRITEVSL